MLLVMKKNKKEFKIPNSDFNNRRSDFVFNYNLMKESHSHKFLTILVPHLPARASTAVLKLVIMAGLPVASTNSIAARTFGPIEPALKWP